MANVDAPTLTQAQTSSVLSHITDSSLFPVEPLVKIVEAAVESRVRHWQPSSTSTYYALRKYPAMIFSWPDGIADQTRDSLERTVADALLKVCIVKIGASCSFSGPEYLYISSPTPAKRRENLLRRLVIDVSADRLCSRTNGNVMIALIRDISRLAATYSRLAVCALFINISVKYTTTNGVDLNSLIARMFGQIRENVPEGQEGPGTIGELVLALIAAFARSNLGKRKLIRFSSTDGRGFYGPLIRVDSQIARSDYVVAQEEQSHLDATRIFNKAFGKGPRSWVLREL